MVCMSVGVQLTYVKNDDRIGTREMKRLLKTTLIIFTAGSICGHLCDGELAHRRIKLFLTKTTVRKGTEIVRSGNY